MLSGGVIKCNRQVEKNFEREKKTIVEKYLYARDSQDTSKFHTRTADINFLTTSVIKISIECG